MTTRQPTPSAQFTTLLARLSPEVVALVKRCLPKLRRALPGSNEIVYEYSKSVVVSFSMSERGYEAIVTMAIYSDQLRLYFDRTIPDPKGLLEGSAGKVRYVIVESASELDKGDIHALIKAAKKHSGATFPRTGSKTTMIIKSKAKK
jgi:hypothetical protein